MFKLNVEEACACGARIAISGAESLEVAVAHVRAWHDIHRAEHTMERDRLLTKQQAANNVRTLLESIDTEELNDYGKGWFVGLINELKMLEVF